MSIAQLEMLAEQFHKQAQAMVKAIEALGRLIDVGDYDEALVSAAALHSRAHLLNETVRQLRTMDKKLAQLED